MSQPIQKKLKINLKNLSIGVLLLSALVLLNPVDATTDSGKLFYNIVAIMTGLMFPWLHWVPVEEEKKNE